MKASPLADAIDPKAFFMMLSTNFPAIYRGGKLHLSLIWDALAAKHPQELLIGLFLKFEQAAKELRIPAELPDSVKSLPHDVQQLHLLRFAGIDPMASVQDSSGLTPLVALEAIQDEPPALPLNTGDLKPLVNDDLKRRISQAIVAGVRGTAIAQKVQPAQVAFLIDSNFDQLCDGSKFDFRPVYDAFRDLGDVHDSDIYAVVVRLHDVLDETGVELVVPEIQIDPQLAAQIAQRARQKGPSDPRIPAYNTPQPAPLPKQPTGDVPQPGTTTPPKPLPAQDNSKEARLRRAGLRSSIPWKHIRVAVLSAIAIAAGTFMFLNRPNRELDVEQFAMIPLKKAELVDNVFQATIDETRWFKLTLDQRHQALADLTDVLQQNNWLQDTQIRDARNAVVIVAKGPKLIGAPIVMNRRLPGDESKNISAKDKPPETPTN